MTLKQKQFPTMCKIVGEENIPEIPVSVTACIVDEINSKIDEINKKMVSIQVSIGTNMAYTEGLSERLEVLENQNKELKKRNEELQEENAALYAEE